MTSTTPGPWPDTTTLSTQWESRLGTNPPLGNDLRAAFPERWVRLYYLPKGQRVARTRAERAEVLARFNSVLHWLGVAAEPTLLVTTCGWGSSSPAPRPPDLAELLPGAHWTDVPATSTDDVPASVYATAMAPARDQRTLEEFLLVWVADALTAEAIIAPASLEWLVHPYDGGMDVIARNTAERDHLAAKFSSWLSERPDGL